MLLKMKENLCSFVILDNYFGQLFRTKLISDKLFRTRVISDKSYFGQLFWTRKESFRTVISDKFCYFGQIISDKAYFSYFGQLF